MTDTRFDGDLREERSDETVQERVPLDGNVLQQRFQSADFVAFVGVGLSGLRRCVRCGAASARRFKPVSVLLLIGKCYANASHYLRRPTFPLQVPVRALFVGVSLVGAVL
jgi:hypothetical protein